MTSRGNPTQLEEALEKLNSLGTPQLKKLAKKLGVSTTIQSKPKGIEAIREHLTRPTPTESDEPTVVEEQGSPSISEEKLSRIVATLHALREKAEPEDAPEDEINEELASLESEMNREEAIATAKAFGVPWSTHSRPDALQRIRERVFEAKISREKVEY